MPSSPRATSYACSSKRNAVALRCFTAVLLAILLAFPASLCLPAEAQADIRRTDVIYGDTMESRGLKPTSCPNIGSEFVYVCSEDGTEYFARSADDATQIASITKVMTALVALENSGMDREVTVSRTAASVGESSANLQAGDVLTMENALKGLMIPSGNDAAIAIAETIGPDFQAEAKETENTLHRADGSAIDSDDPASALDAFVAKMNEKAAELGCQNTVFENPHGLDGSQFAGDLHSTAREVAKICAYAMGIDAFRSLCDIPRAEIPVKRNGEDITVELKTTDLLLGNYEGACGIKTGNTDLAGPCFAGACNREGSDLYAIILHSASEEQRFIDCKTLFDWVYDNQIAYDLAHSSQETDMTLDGQTRQVPVVAEVALDAWVDKTVPATFKDPDAQVEVFAPQGNVSQRFELDDVSGGVSAGQVIGKATFYQQNQEIASVEIVACEDVPAPSLFESIGIWWDKTCRTLSGQPTSAESTIINETPLILEKS